MGKVTTITDKAPVAEKPLLRYDGNLLTLDEIMKAIASDYQEGDNRFRLNDVKSRTRQFEFNMEELPHCCGIIEVGGFYLEGAKELFDGIKEVINSIGNLIKGNTAILTLNDKDLNKKLRSIMRECPNWTLVKVFVNSNTNNEIEVWMSNND